MDNIVTNPGAGGAVLASDDIGGVQFPRLKLTLGADGVNDGDVSAANPMPVTLGASTVPVSAAALPLPTGAATEVSMAKAASPVYMEDSLANSGDPGMFMLAVRRDADTTTAADGDYTALKMDDEGRLKVASKPASYAPTTGNVTTATSTVFVDTRRFSNLMIHCTGTFAGVNCTFEGSLNSTNGTDGNWFAVQAVRTNANTIELTTGVLGAAPAYAWELSVNALTFFRVRATAWTSGTQVWTFVPGTYATEPIPAQQVSGTQPVSGTVTASNAAGTAAHSAAASGNPVQIGGVVATAVSTAEVAGDACRIAMTTGGQQLVKPYGLPETDWQYAAASGGIINTTDVVARAAGAAGVRNYVTGLSLSNNSATATEFVIKDGAAVIWRGHCPANMPNMHYPFPTPLRGTAATAINIACITTAAAVYANLQGYQAP